MSLVSATVALVAALDEPSSGAGISSSALSSTPLFVQPALLFALWFVSSLLLRFVPVSQSPVLT